MKKESLILDETSTTPKVSFDPDMGVFEIAGRSIPNDTDSFYSPILEWLNDYAKTPNKHTELTIFLDFFNISSSKRLLFIFYKLAEINSEENQVLINWLYHHDDAEMLEVGQDYSIMVKIPFNFVPQ